MPSLAPQNWVFFFFFHVFIISCKEIFTRWALLYSWMFYFFLSFNISPYLASIGKVNLVGAVARCRNIFIINSLIDNISRGKFYLFFESKLMFYYLITVTFLYNLAWKILRGFIFSFTFFLSKTWTCPFSQKISGKNCVLTKPHLLQNICQNIWKKFYQVEYHLWFPLAPHIDLFQELLAPLFLFLI